MAATMLVALGSATSCGNKENSQEFIAGTPYTFIALDTLESGKEYTVEFGCKGVPTTYWDFVKSPEVSDHSKAHTYKGADDYAPVILIEGNISSLWLCDAKGNLLADGNAKIEIVMFSNTITSIREYACYGLELLGAYIPASVKTIGKNAFLPYEPQAFFCEPLSRPSGWDVYWCTLGEYNRVVTWGLSYHIDKDTGGVYLLVSDDDVKTAFYQGSIFPNPSDNLVIPKKITINKRDFTVALINDVGSARNIKSVTIPESIVFIGASAFKDCTELTEVKFEGNFAYLKLESDVFWSCKSLKKITLPEGLVDLPQYTFEDCTNLEYVKIPSSVTKVQYNVFYENGAANDLTIDLTAFKDASKIANCDGTFLYECGAKNVTFKIDSNLKKEDFFAKGWPENYKTIKIVWDSSPTSLV